MQKGIGLYIPVIYDKTDGPWKTTKTFTESIKQNLKNLLLTAPGERIMEPDFGCGLREFLFEHITPEVVNNMTARVRTQIQAYMSFLQVKEFRAKSENNILYLYLEYYIPKINLIDNLFLGIEE